MKVAMGSGCPSATAGSTAPGMLSAAEMLLFVFVLDLVPFLPAQVLSRRRRGIGNAVVSL